MLTKLTIAQYLKRSDAYPMPVATIRRYIETGVLRGEKIKSDFTGKTLQEITVLTLRDWLEPFTPHARKGNRF